MPLLPAQDFKRALDGDAGPNTGGMGAYTPLPWAPERSASRRSSSGCSSRPSTSWRRRGTPFAGLLYAGLALTAKRGVQVVEFNARFGDPETQPLLALLSPPLGALLKAAADGRLADVGPLTVDAGRGRRRRRRRRTAIPPHHAPGTRSTDSPRPNASTAST